MQSFTFHIFLSSIEHETRLYKEAAYTLSAGICRRVVVQGVWREGLAAQETTDYGLEIRRLPTLIRRYQNSTLINRFGYLRKILALLSLFQYALACILAARQMRPDHVSCHNAVMLPVAWAASRFSGATLEYLPHELETQRTGLTGITKRITAFLERQMIRSARNIVVVCDPIRKWYEDTYGLTNVYVVRNVPEKNAVKIRRIPDGGLRERFGIPDGAKLFIYQGMFSAGRGIDALIEAFSELEPDRFHLVLMGYGDKQYLTKINEAVREGRNVHYQPAVAREWIVSYSAGADVGISISERASLSYRHALPNKFFEWAHAGLPILVSDNLEYQADLLRKGKFGWSTSLTNLIDAVREISNTDLTHFKVNARLFAEMAVWDEDAKAFAQVYQTKIND